MAKTYKPRQKRQCFKPTQPFIKTEVVLSVDDGKHHENILVAQNGEVFFDNLHGHGTRIGE